ncbi:MAG: type IV secretory system conjugative DNA transfer family protein [Cyanobacteria bacterium P01_F01_bin.53]
MAEQTGCYWTFTEFKRLQNNSPEKPVEPTSEDPSLWPAPGDPLPPALVAKHGPHKARERVAAYNLTQARNAYETALKEYQELQLQIRAIRAAADFSPRGYALAFIRALQFDFPAFVESFFFAPTTLWINEKAREKHTFICAGTGSGKSESIKHIARHYVTANTEPTIVVLDPHDDLAQDIARFRQNADNGRLIYVNPTLFKGRRIAFNPFDTTDKDEHNLNFGQRQFLGALEQLFGQSFTAPQKALLTPCLGVLLHMDGTTFADLVTFMDDDRNTALVNYGKANLPNQADREFMRDQFYSSNFEATKQALRYRFYELVRDPVVRDFLCSESTFDFANALDTGKIICFGFDRDRVTEDAVKTIGQLINAYLVSFAMRRPQGQRRPIHLFADECQYFISPTISQIMGETRKFGLHATLATQRIEQVGKDVQKAILGNVGTYLIGRSKDDTAEKMGKEIPQLSANDIRELPPLHFYQIELDRDPVKARIEVIGRKKEYLLSGEEWLKVLLAQGRAYYQPNRPAPPSEHNGRPQIQEANQARQPKALNQGPKFKGPDFTKKPKK